MFGFPTDLIRHFLVSFASEVKLNLHTKVLYGANDYHKAKALFKALGKALDMARQLTNASFCQIFLVIFRLTIRPIVQ